MAAPIAKLVLLALVGVAESKAYCNSSLSMCPRPEDCCASAYSPSHFGCTVDVGDLPARSAGCGDGLGPANATSVCCKMGPEKPPHATKKNVLVIGDSVSIGYTTLATKNVEALLFDVAQVQHGPWDVSDGGAGDAATGVACLDRWLVTQAMVPVKWDVITFNFGLHDMTNSSRCEGLYASQLANITARLAALGTKLVYFTTTPYMPLRAAGNTVVEDMNDIALEIMEPYGVDVVDLYATVTAHCGAVYTDCDVCRAHPCSFHYNDAGMNAQAAVVAGAIAAALA